MYTEYLNVKITLKRKKCCKWVKKLYVMKIEKKKTHTLWSHSDSLDSDSVIGDWKKDIGTIRIFPDTIHNLDYDILS